jgi:thiamine kinase-like enzyme
MAGTPDTFHADMEFVAAKDFIQFLSEADRQALDGFLKIVTDFISRNLTASKSADVSRQIEEKLAELAKKNVPAKYIEAAKRMCHRPVQVPVGPCHGDLTLSNILFKSDRLYLLDFLDCYVESPLQDIAKLRQDTHFGWSLQLYQADFNWAKIQIALRYLDRLIETSFMPYEWHRHYELFQIINLMRILPYCTETRTADFITQSLDRTLKKSVA